MKRLLTDEQHAYLKEISEGRSSKECVEMLNKKYGLNLNYSQIKGYRSRYKIRAGKPSGYFSDHSTERIFTDEIENFIKENYKNRYSDDLTKIVNKKFGTNYSRQQIVSFKKRNKLNSGLITRFEKGQKAFNKGMKQEDYMPKEAIERSKATRFQKGNHPHNEALIGEERVSSGGYLVVKVNDLSKGGRKTNWITKAKQVWEEHHGQKIPEGMFVTYLDGNELNCDPENLALVTRSENLYLNRHQLRSSIPEVTAAGVALAKFGCRVKEIEKKRKEENE